MEKSKTSGMKAMWMKLIDIAFQAALLALVAKVTIATGSIAPVIISLAAGFGVVFLAPAILGTAWALGKVLSGGLSEYNSKRKKLATIKKTNPNDEDKSNADDGVISKDNIINKAKFALFISVVALYAQGFFSVSEAALDAVALSGYSDLNIFLGSLGISIAVHASSGDSWLEYKDKDKTQTDEQTEDRTNKTQPTALAESKESINNKQTDELKKAYADGAAEGADGKKPKEAKNPAKVASEIKYRK